MHHGAHLPRRPSLGSQELKAGEIQFFETLPNAGCDGLYVAMESDHTLRRIAQALNSRHALSMGHAGVVESVGDGEHIAA